MAAPDADLVGADLPRAPDIDVDQRILAAAIRGTFRSGSGTVVCTCIGQQRGGFRQAAADALRKQPRSVMIT